MYCARCGTKNDDTAAFCSSCGEPVTAPSTLSGAQSTSPAPAYAGIGSATPPPYGTPGYATTSYQRQGPATASTNGMAVAAMICGILGVLGGFLSILGLIFGYVAKGQIDRSGGRTTRIPAG
jgi:hypothetical protein